MAITTAVSNPLERCPIDCAWQFLNAQTSVYRWEADSRHSSASLVCILKIVGTPVCCITLPAALQHCRLLQRAWEYLQGVSGVRIVWLLIFGTQ